MVLLLLRLWQKESGLSLQQTNLANYKKSRVSELILKDEVELIQVMKIEMINNFITISIRI